jgi:hypothetical protein
MQQKKNCIISLPSKQSSPMSQKKAYRTDLGHSRKETTVCKRIHLIETLQHLYLLLVVLSNNILRTLSC